MISLTDRQTGTAILYPVISPKLRVEHDLAYYIKRCIVYDQSDRQTGTAILDPVISPKLRVAGGWSMPLLIT